MVPTVALVSGTSAYYI